MMEANWKFTRILGLTCCLAFLTAVSMAQSDGAALQTRTAVVKVQAADGTLIADAVVTYRGTGGEQLVATPQGDGTYLIPNAAQKLSLHIEHPSMQPTDLDSILTGMNSTVLVNVRGSVVDSKVISTPAPAGPTLGLATLGTAGAGAAQRSASARTGEDDGPAAWSNVAPTPDYSTRPSFRFSDPDKGPKAGAGDCPASACGDDTLTQSLDLETDSLNQVACGIAGVSTTENGWARCFNLTDEGFLGDVFINSVTFGVQQATIDNINVDVNLYVNPAGCPAALLADADLIDSVSTVLGTADEGGTITLNFPGTEIAAGSALIVEVANPDDLGLAVPPGQFRVRSNDVGACGPSFIRAAQCGLGDWTDLAAIGFPDAHLVLSINATAAECAGGPGQCGDGVCDGDETCENCPEDCCPDEPECGDGVCNGDETCENCPEDCCPPPECGDGVCDVGAGDCPASDCAAGTISQSQSLEIVPLTGVSCANGGLTTPNAYARCFNLADEGFAGAVTITSVDFGFETEPGFNVPVFANIYDTNGNPCPATGYGPGDVILLGTAETVAGPGSAGTLLNAEFAVPVEIAAGSTIIIEFEQLDDGVAGGFALFPGANGLGECGDGSIRAADCGLADWATYTEIGFPAVHLAMQANGSSEECGGGGGEDCESCPEDCGVCPGAGACCIAGNCEDDLSEGDCAAQGGDFQGEGTTCEGGGGGEGQEHTSNPNVAIPDNTPGGVSDTINVPGDETIEDIDIDLVIDHTWVGDLCVTVEHNGTSVIIIQRMGDAGGLACDGGCCGCSADNMDILLSDGGGGAINDQCVDNLTGTYDPQNPLSAFNGMGKGGDWTITVNDNAAADTGTLVTWSLHINGGGGGGGIDCGPVGECGDGVCDDGGGGDCDPSDCCGGGDGTPGCDCQSCQDTVCALDPFCCDSGWDSICAGEAVDFCGDLCTVPGACCDDGGQPGGPSDCCVDNGTPGCDCPECQKIVCGADPFCCDVSWDGACALQAADLCGDLCPAGQCGGGGGGGEDCESCPEDCGPCCVCGDGELCGDDEECDGGLCADGQECNEDCTCPDTPSCEDSDADVIEDEPNCGLPADTVNGGCNSVPPVFTPVNCGDTVCGTAAFDVGLGLRDTDWYELILDEPSDVTWTVTADFNDLLIFIIIPLPDCNLVDIGDAGIGGPAGVPVTLTRFAIPAGPVWLFAANNFSAGGLECGAEYNGLVECEAAGCDSDADCDPPEICGPDDICVLPPPENDDCADALPGSCGDTAFTTIDAITDGPAHPECQFDGQTYHDIWYEFIAPTGGNLTVSTCDLVDYDSDLVVYDGCDCGALNLLGCNDDGLLCGAFSSEVTVPVVGGNCYLVRVGGWQDGNFGTGTLRLSGPPCEIPVGACCFGADCVENLPEEDCGAQGGEWQDAGSACNEAGETVVAESTPGLPLSSTLPPAVDTIDMGMDFQLQDVDIDVVIDHTWIGDLFITVEHAGTTVVLWDNACGNTDNMNVIFDDEGGNVNCVSPVTGNIDPASASGGALSAFDGLSSAGAWTISVEDQVGGDDGTLVQWSIHLTQPGDSICGCGGPEDCNDGDACTDDVCGEDGECSNPPVDCGDLDDDCNVGVCVDGDCVAQPTNEGGACGDQSSGDCDNPNTCSEGVCQDNNEDADTSCTDDGNDCTDDVCNGSGSCTHPNEDAGTGCGDAGDSDCDNPDSCDGNGNCQDNLEDAGTGCTDDGNECTDDICDGGGSCTHPNLADGTACNSDSDNCTTDECADGECTHPSIEQTLIIKQGACPAPVNPNSNGVMPMLLVGRDGFNVNNINRTTLDLHRCDGVGDSATPLADHTMVKDLNHPGDSVGCGECACNDDQSSDGVDDLSLKFRTSDTLAALMLGVGDGVVTLELTGEMMDGTPFCARDCVIIVPPGSGTSNMSMEASVFDTFVEVEPLDLNVDSDGFSNFSRAYLEGTNVTINAPLLSNGRRFLRWSVDGVLQPFGLRTIEVTATAEDIALMALYVRPGRLVPDRPEEDDGDLE